MTAVQIIFRDAPRASVQNLIRGLSSRTLKPGDVRGVRQRPPTFRFHHQELGGLSITAFLRGSPSVHFEVERTDRLRLYRVRQIIERVIERYWLARRPEILGRCSVRIRVPFSALQGANDPHAPTPALVEAKLVRSRHLGCSDRQRVKSVLQPSRTTRRPVP
ncbi:MAG: hypothetical protein KDD44_13990, partial [Bdellovibrionales bacterium]|nr:hypothetical protein [Bdellovibrionales bacterium]